MKRNPHKKYRNKVQKNWSLPEDELISFLDKLFDEDKNALFEQSCIIDLFIQYMESIKPYFTEEVDISIPGLEIQDDPKQGLSDYDSKYVEVLTWLMKKKVFVLKEFYLNVSIAIFELKEWIDKEYRVSYIKHQIQEIESMLGNEKSQEGSGNPYYEINELFKQGQYPDVFSHDVDNISTVETMIAFKAYLKGLLNSGQEPVNQDQITIQGEIKGEKDIEGNLVVTIPMEKIQDDIIHTVKENISTEKPVPDDKLALFTVKETCKMLKITPQTLSSWTRQGRIQAYRLVDKPVRYKKRDIEKLLTRMNIIPEVE